MSTTLPTTSASEYLDVSVSGPAVFASGYSGIHDGLLVRFDADGGVEEFTDPRWARMNAVVARSPTDVWAAGEQDIVAHFDGTSWTTSTTGTRTGWDTGVEWYDIWLDATGEVVLVGEGGRVARRALGASTWVATPTGTGADLRAVWGLSDGDLIAVGQAGVVLRLGATVTRIEVGTGEDMFSVWQAPSGDVFIGSRGYTVTRGH